MAVTAFAASRPAAALAGAQLRLPGCFPSCLLPSPPTRRSLSSFPLHISSSRSHDACGPSSLVARATFSSDESSAQSDDILADLKEKWNSIEDKSTVVIYGGGALVALWLSSVVVGAVNSVPLLPSIMELVGIGYTGWFVYRYLLFKESRKEFAGEIETLKKKIVGTD